MKNVLNIFKNEELQMEIRCLLINEEPWIIGKDLIESLGYNLEGKHVASEYIKKFCDEEDFILLDKNSPSQQGAVINYKDLGQRGGYLVNESGMYALIFGSELSSAKQFKKWVTKEVLPSIRKHGAYISENEDSVDQDYIKFSYGQLKNTFLNFPIEKLSQTYDECMKWHKNNKTRIPYAKNSKRRCDALILILKQKL